MSQRVQASPPRLFVYGTLAPGEVNEHVLAPLDGSWVPARVYGTLHAEGWGHTHGFPALRLTLWHLRWQGKFFTRKISLDTGTELMSLRAKPIAEWRPHAELINGGLCETCVYILNA